MQRKDDMTIRTREQAGVCQDDVDTVSMDPAEIKMVLDQVEALFGRYHATSKSVWKATWHD